MNKLIFLSIIALFIAGNSFSQKKSTTTEPTFYLDTNGVTIKCSDCVAGDTGTVDGILYEAVDRALLEQRRDEGADLSKVCTSLVTDMSFIFFMSSFNQPIGSWDVSNVTRMNNMFIHASLFNQDISLWDVSNVTDMSGMFDWSSFNQPIGSWDVSNVTDMVNMFRGASLFNQDISLWDVSNVTNMSNMFRKASSFNEPLDLWDVGNVTNLNSMFEDANSFDQPLNSWDVSNVTELLYN